MSSSATGTGRGSRCARAGTSELHRTIEGVSQRMLTRTLRTLESDGLVVRTVHPTVPPGVEYDLTPLGRSLLVPVSALAEWAVEHAAELGDG